MMVTLLLIVALLVLCASCFAAGIWVFLTFRYVVPGFCWEKTSGVITDSRVVANKNCNGLPGYHYRVSCEFKVGEVEYVSTTVRLGDFRYFTRRAAEEMAAKYPVGTEVPVCVEPDFAPNPDSDVQPFALLEPGLNWECLYPVVVFLIPFILAVFLVAKVVDQ
jgi:hypothetical protein